MIAGQLAAFAPAVATNLIAGRLGADVLGEVAIGNVLWVLAAMPNIGVAMALQPIVSALDGAGRRSEAAPWFRQALLVGLALGAAVGVLLFALGPTLLRLAHTAPALRPAAGAYLRVVAFGMPGIGVFAAARGTSEGLSRTLPTMIVEALAIVPIAAVAFVLMRGGFGLPALGAAGAAAATVGSAWGQGLAYALWVRRTRSLGVDWRGGSWRPDAQRIRRMVALGAPIAVTLLLEVGMYSVAGLVTAAIGPAAAAGSQIALNVTSVLFMAPLGLGLALTVRVGNAVGRADGDGIRLAILSGACALALVVAVEAIVLGAGRLALARLYATDPRVVRLASVLLLIWVLGVLPDGVQVVSNAVLRGLRDTRVPMLLTAVAYWLVGVPLMLLFTFRLGLGAAGAWLGLLAGGTAAAVLLGARVRRGFLRAHPRSGVAAEPPLVAERSLAGT